MKGGLKKKINVVQPPKANPSRVTSRTTATRAAKRCTCSVQSNEITLSADKDICAICGFSTRRVLSGIHGQQVFHPCYASICLQCLQRCLVQQYKSGITQLFCPICLTQFTPAQQAQIHPELNNQISEALTLQELDNIIQCRFCNNKFFYEPADPSTVEPLYNGRQLTSAQIMCAAQNLMCCNECGISTCVTCGSIPYHIGETCEEHKWFVEGSVCRICECAANPTNAPDGHIALLTCTNQQCIETSSRMCAYIHPCGHACTGIRGETKHPPCPQCSDTGTMCPHCKTELWGHMCILLYCGHTIHAKCCLEIISRPRTGPELILPLCPAPGCGDFVKHPYLLSHAATDYAEWSAIEAWVNWCANGRVLAEGIEFHPEVVSRSSPFSHAGSKAALNWAKKRLRFMVCNRHSPPIVYTSGRLDDPRGDENISCPMCPNYQLPLCDLHGYWAMSYKCETCCSIAVRQDSGSLGKQPLMYCEICHDMPGHKMAQSSCKGNCRFSPHPGLAKNCYGRCAKCGRIVSIVKKR